MPKKYKPVVLAEEETLTNDVFIKAFERSMEHINKTLDNHKGELGSVAKTLAENFSKLRDELTDLANKKVGEVSDTERDIKDAVRAKLSEIDGIIKDKLNEIKDGKDADDEAIAESVKDMLVGDLPTLEDITKELPALGEPIRDSLELLEGDERLKIEAIKDLREELDELKKKVKSGSLGGGAGASLPLASWPRHEAFTMDGVATSVTLLNGGVGAGGNAIIVRYQGQTLDMTTHYTVSGNTVTFVGFTPEADTIISVTYWT